MNGQQVKAWLGQWYDVVGGRGGRGGRGPAARRGDSRRWRGYSPYGDDGYDPYAQPEPYYPQPYYPQPYPQLYYPQPPQPYYPQAPQPLPYAQPESAPTDASTQPAPTDAPAAPPTAAGFWPGGPAAYPFPPRAAVVAAPLPTQANRDILPMSTGVPILPTQSAQITGRPQVLVFKCGAFVISNGGTSGGAADWIVNDIKIGNRSQFVQSGDVPGDMFATNAVNTFVRFESAQTAMDIVVVVTYIGLNDSGCPFFGAMLGTAAV